MIGLQYTFGLSLRKMGLGCTWNLPFMLVRYDTSATAVHLGGMQMDLDSARVFPSKFSSVSRTSLSSVHILLVPCLVHPTDGIWYGEVSAQDDRSAHFCTYYKRVCKSVFVDGEVKCDSFGKHVMTSSSFKGWHETSVQAIYIELSVSIQVHTTPFCSSIQKGFDCPAIDFYGEDCSCIIASGGGVDLMNMGISCNVLVVLTRVITWFEVI